MQSKMLGLALLLGALTALGPMCTDYYLSALPEISGELGVSDSFGQLTLSAALAGLGIGQLIFGPVSDRAGRRYPLIFSLILFIIASQWCATAHSLSELLIARFLQGIGGAGGAVLSRSVASDLYQGTALTVFYSLLMSVNGIAPVIAPVLGSVQFTVTGWRPLFYTLTALGIILLVISYFFLKETKPVDNSLHKEGHSGSVFRDKVFMGYCLMQGFMMAGLFAYIGGSSYVLQQDYGLTAHQYSYVFAVNGTGLIIFSLAAARLTNIIGDIKTLSYLVLIIIIAALGLLAASSAGLSLWLILPLLFLAVGLNSGVCTIASSVAMRRQQSSSGSASAWMGLFMFAMGGISAPLTTLGGASGLKMAAGIYVCYLFSGIVFFLMRNKLREE